MTRLELAAADWEEKRLLEFEQLGKITFTFTDADSNIVYKAEVDRSFDGGNRLVIKYWREIFSFRRKQKVKGLEGTVYVDFIVGLQVMFVKLS